MSSSTSASLPLRSLNHLSLVCRDVRASAAFYRDVLGFMEVKRPTSFEFEGCWLFNYNIGVHLIKGEPVPRSVEINPKSDHMSFQCESLAEVESRLKQRNVKYVRDQVEDSGIKVTQIFFHDPDHNMIEICNCDCLPVVPLLAAPMGSALSSATCAETSNANCCGCSPVERPSSRVSIGV